MVSVDADAVDPWAWLSHPDEPVPAVDLSHCWVTGVLVTLDAATWLPETLAGLAGRRRGPDRLMAIDNGSVDDTRAQLERAQEAGVLDAVYAGKPHGGFGQGVADALRQDAGHGPADH